MILPFFSLLSDCSSCVFAAAGCVAQEADEEAPPTTDDDLGASREGSRTDAEAVQR